MLSTSSATSEVARAEARYLSAATAPITTASIDRPARISRASANESSSDCTPVEPDFRIGVLVVDKGRRSACCSNPVHEGHQLPALVAGNLGTLRVLEALERFGLPCPGCPVLSARCHGHSIMAHALCNANSIALQPS